jgi:hypothetical protein
MGAARPYIGQVTCQGEGVPPTVLALAEKQTHPERSTKSIALKYGLAESTFRHQLLGRQSKRARDLQQQRLTSVEEKGIVR